MVRPVTRHTASELNKSLSLFFELLAKFRFSARAHNQPTSKWTQYFEFGWFWRMFARDRFDCTWAMAAANVYNERNEIMPSHYLYFYTGKTTQNIHRYSTSKQKRKKEILLREFTTCERTMRPGTTDWANESDTNDVLAAERTSFIFYCDSSS